MQGLTKEGIIKFVQEKGIGIMNLCHIPEDCRLKTLSFAVKNREKLEEILEFGERVDGSSLFSYVDPDKSDIYIMPRTASAFVDPFSLTPSVNVLCEYLDENGKPLETAPATVLSKAREKLSSSAKVVLKALAEPEFYIISKQEDAGFADLSDRNYQESAPFTKFQILRNEALTILEDVGVVTKYGHAEVGKFNKAGYSMEQHEIEFLPQNLRETAEAVTIARWVIRNVCRKYGVSVSFAPKLAAEHAGNGMHFHFCALRGNKSIISDSDGNLTIEARQMIGGILKFAPSLTAFGNTIPSSYLRFISRKESPMYICWGAKNRLALVRIPLWWNFKKNFENGCRRTIEFRAPDGSANSYLLLAGIALAVEYGLKNPAEAIRVADDLDADNKEKSRAYGVLPLSCSEAAKNLEADRKYYESSGVFPKRMIDGTIAKLESYNDEFLAKKSAANPEKTEELLWNYFHYG